MAAIDEIHPELPFYGIRRIRGELLARGFAIGRGHLATLMRTMDLSQAPHLEVRPRPTTLSGPSPEPA